MRVIFMVIRISRIATCQQNIYDQLKVGFPPDWLPKQDNSCKNKNYKTLLTGHQNPDTTWSKEAEQLILFHQFMVKLSH